jgi:hypothetical protein
MVPKESRVRPNPRVIRPSQRMAEKNFDHIQPLAAALSIGLPAEIF